MIALAIETRCFWPPDKVTPLSPRIVLYPSLKSRIFWWTTAFFAAFIISWFVAFSLPNLILLEIVSENKKASIIFKKFARILDAFDNRNNIVIAVVGSGLFLWEIANACKVEKWVENYKHTVKKWFEVVAYFDAQNSLANFKFNHPDFVFPEIKAEEVIIKSTNLGHPLLDSNKRIDNNFIIDDEQFFIVTGSNMAGKSTFLRTVSLFVYKI